MIYEFIHLVHLPHLEFNQREFTADCLLNLQICFKVVIVIFPFSAFLRNTDIYAPSNAGNPLLPLQF